MSPFEKRAATRGRVFGVEQSAPGEVESSRRTQQYLGLWSFFPLGFWLAPWLVKKVRGTSLGRATQNLLLLVIGTGTAILWNGGLLLVVIGIVGVSIIMGGMEEGFLGQDMQEKWAIKTCLRQVRDGEIASVDQCDEFARFHLPLYQDDWAGFSTPADMLCMASLAHLNYGFERYGESSVILELKAEAAADCAHAGVNKREVTEAARRRYGNNVDVTGLLQQVPK